MGSAPENVSQWVAGIVAALKKATVRSWRQRHSPSDITDQDITVQSHDGRATPAEREGVTTESPIARLTTGAFHTEGVAIGAKSGQDGQVGCVAVLPDDQEIQRRRDLVRALFNDFWSGFDNKPASFADRLDQAEDYLNERLTASGEFWRLDTKTRELLGLPPPSNSPDGAKRALRR
jgi:hypothetical protein